MYIIYIYIYIYPSLSQSLSQTLSPSLSLSLSLSQSQSQYLWLSRVRSAEIRSEDLGPRKSMLAFQAPGSRPAFPDRLSERAVRKHLSLAAHPRRTRDRLIQAPREPVRGRQAPRVLTLRNLRASVPTGQDLAPGELGVPPPVGTGLMGT